MVQEINKRYDESYYKQVAEDFKKEEKEFFNSIDSLILEVGQAVTDLSYDFGVVEASTIVMSQIIKNPRYGCKLLTPEEVDAKIASLKRDVENGWYDDVVSEENKKTLLESFYPKQLKEYVKDLKETNPDWKPFFFKKSAIDGIKDVVSQIKKAVA